MTEQTISSGGVAATIKPKWKPLARIDRRIAGVLVEKAKTTPEQYPMTINGLLNGANQKSNRDPQMQLEEGDIMESLDRLKMAGAVVEVQGSGRVPKFRHLMYEWLAVDKVELAVMTELLLRGAQTEGELRGRASRMEPIADLTALRTVLDSLRAKGLITYLTPAGRGQMLTHSLYEPEEMERLKAKIGTVGAGEDFEAAPAMNRASSPPSAPRVPAATASVGSSSAAMSPTSASVSAASEKIRDEMRSLRSEVAELRRELESLTETVRKQENEIADLRTSLGG
jgi:hypothetical protein